MVEEIMIFIGLLCLFKCDCKKGKINEILSFILSKTNCSFILFICWLVTLLTLQLQLRNTNIISRVDSA